MKELSIEQKAKRYDKALEKSKRLYEQGTITESLAYIFPELKESEDEKIRKEIVSYIKSSGAVTNKQWIAWLEKQKVLTTEEDLQGKEDVLWCIKQAQKYTKDENEMGTCWFAENWLKKQGENNKYLYIRFGDIPKDEKSKVYNGEIEVGTENGVSVYPAFEDSEGNIVLGLSLPITKTSLYTQQHLLEYDNRACYLVSGDYVGKGTDGEPLLRNVKIVREIKDFRVKQSEQKSIVEMKSPEESLGIDSDTYNKIVDECIYGEQKPADKVEPKFKVGQTIKKEGFNSGFPIVKIENGFYYNDMGDNFPFTDQDNWELVEQKPVDKVEPKFKVGDKIYLKPEYRMPDDDTPIVNTIHEIIAIDDKHYRFEWSYIFIEDQDKYELVEQKPADWSEEDEKMFNRCIKTMKSAYYLDGEALYWLKNRFKIPQKQWKPSEKQMKALDDVISSKDIKYDVLSELWKDLKKLREE